MNVDILTAEHVSYRYAGTPVLHDVSLRVAAASMLAVTGPNGCGKSTLLHLLAGVDTPTEGRVHRGKTTRVALLPQRTGDIDALPLTAAESVHIGRFRPRRRLRRDDHTAVTEIMERLDITHLARRRLRELSGGQRQRTLLAQALVQDADIYILDEPCMALDSRSRQHVHDLLAQRIQGGAAVVLATHDTTEASLADQTLDLGRAEAREITADGTRDRAPQRGLY